MKKFLLTAFLGISVLLAFGQQPWDNFEDQRRGFYDFTSGTFIPYFGNPDPTGNTSPVVAEYTRNAAELFDVLVIDAVSPAEDLADYLSGAKQLSIDVWSPNAGVTVQITLEDSSLAGPANFPTGRHSVYLTTTTVANAWETLTFTFDNRPDPGVPNTTVSRLVLLFNPNSNTSDTYYFDNLVGPTLAADPCAGTMPMDTVLNDFECNQNTAITFTHGQSLRRIPNPDQSGINPTDYVGTYTRNPGEEFDAIVGSFAAPLALGDTNAFALKVWDANAPTVVRLALQFDDGTGAAPVEVAAISDSTSASSTWEELVFNFGDLSAETVNSFVLLFDPGDFTSNSYFFDDFRFATQGGLVNIDAPQLMSAVSVFPNPSQGVTQFSYELVERGEVALTVFDLAGKTVAHFEPGMQAAGPHALDWEARGLPAGMYVYRLATQGHSTQGKVMLAR
jgi:hypothetical protein